MGPVLGSCLGPIAGGFITDYTSWRWAFHATSVAGGAYLLLSCVITRETYVPVLLQRKKKKMLMDRNGDEKRPLRTPYEKTNETVAQMYQRTMCRPFYLLATQPIVQALAAYYGFLYGLIYLLLSSFSELWTAQYRQSLSRGSINYLAPCVGYTAGAVVCMALANRSFAYLKTRNGGVEKPELRIPMMVPAALLVPIGLFWYGWSAEYKLHWIVPDIGIALPLMGSTVIFQCVSAYLLDTFTGTYAASASGAVYVLRGLAGFGFPLFAQQMYSRLGYGWGNSILGFVALIMGFPIPFVLWKYGERLRAASTFIEWS